MAELKLSTGETAEVDDEDLDRLSGVRWWRHRYGDLVYAEGIVDGKRVKMHRYVLRLKPGDPHVDHADGNGLNNRKSNLRFTDKTKNKQNQRRAQGVSRFKGVTKHKKTGKWEASLKVHYKRMYLGLHETEEQAARAYDVAAREHFGETACTNEDLGLYSPTEKR